MTVAITFSDVYPVADAKRLADYSPEQVGRLWDMASQAYDFAVDRFLEALECSGRRATPETDRLELFADSAHDQLMALKDLPRRSPPLQAVEPVARCLHGEDCACPHRQADDRLRYFGGLSDVLEYALSEAIESLSEDPEAPEGVLDDLLTLAASPQKIEIDVWLDTQFGRERAMLDPAAAGIEAARADARESWG